MYIQGITDCGFCCNIPSLLCESLGELSHPSDWLMSIQRSIATLNSQSLLISTVNCILDRSSAIKAARSYFVVYHDLAETNNKYGFKLRILLFFSTSQDPAYPLTRARRRGNRLALANQYRYCIQGP